jgi:hypothetical protein
VLFISSTSVYNDVDAFTEETIANLLLKAGNNYWKQNNYCKAISILNDTSFGGLIGEDRHPVKFLRSRKSRKSNAPINLIHQEDCIGIINYFVTTGLGRNFQMLLHRIILLERNITLKGCRIEFGFTQIHH